MSSIFIPRNQMNSFDSGELSSLLHKQPDLKLTASSVYDNGESERMLKRVCDSLPKEAEGVRSFCELDGTRLFALRDYLSAFGVSGRMNFDFRNRFLMPIVETMKLDEKDAEKTFPLALIRTDESPDFGTLIIKGGKANYISALYLFYAGKRELETIDDYAMWPSTGTTPFEYSPALNFVKAYDSDFEDASKILQAAHPELHLNNVRLWIKSHFIHELHNLNAIDFWQDISACREVNCAIKSALDAAFPEISGTSELPAAWKVITAIEGNKMKQGFGPGQIILGQAMEAASDSAIFARYAHILPAATATDPDAMLLAILDPKKSIYIKTMIYDHILTKLKETVFASPEVRFASDIYPYMDVPSASREAALIWAAQYLAIYPERYASIKKMLKAGMGLQHFNDLCGYADMLGIEPYFPGIHCEKAVVKRLTYIVDDKKYGLKVADDLPSEAKAPWTVYFISPGWDLNDLLNYAFFDPFKKWISHF